MKHLAFGLSLLLALTGCQVSFSTGSQPDLPKPTAGTASEQAEAAAAARGYLALIDNEQYEKTWEQGGSALKTMTNRFVWINTLKVLNQTLAISSARELEGFGFSTQIDARVPPGSYVLVQFKSQSGKVTTTEKVVMQEEHGAWKLIGYFRHKHAKFGAGT